MSSQLDFWDAFVVFWEPHSVAVLADCPRNGLDVVHAGEVRDVPRCRGRLRQRGDVGDELVQLVGIAAMQREAIPLGTGIRPVSSPIPSVDPVRRVVLVIGGCRCLDGEIGQELIGGRWYSTR